MIKKFYFSNRQRTLFALFLGAFLVVVAAYCIVTSLTWINRPFPGFVVMGNNLVPVASVPGWEGIERGIKFGDVITEVNGKPSRDGTELYNYVAGLKPGTPVTYTVRRQGSNHKVTVPVGVFTFSNWLLLFPGMMFLGVCLYVMGMVTFIVKPNNFSARAFLVNGITVGTVMVVTPAYITTHFKIFELIALPLIGPSFTLLGCYFPQRRPRRKYYLAFAYGIGLPLVALNFLTFNHIEIFTKVDLFFNVHISLNNILGIYLVGKGFYASTDPLDRQKFKVVIYGVCLTTIGTVVFVIGNLILKNMALFWFLPVSLFFIPFSIAYAILKHNLFDVDLFIRRTASYVLASGAAMASFFVLVSLLGISLSRVAGPTSQIAAVLSTIAAVALFRPLQKQVDRFIDRRFFRERYEYRAALREASKVLVSIVELKPLLDRILDTVIDAIKIERGCFLLLDSNAGQFVPVSSRDYEAGAIDPVTVGHPLLELLERSGWPVQKSDFEQEPILDSPAFWARHLMTRMDTVLAVPVIYEQRLIAVLALGAKKSGAWYSTEDMDLLQTLMIQTAVSIENARKVEELKRMVELETSVRELKQINDLKDGILHMVSHDLRTPMTGILGYAYLLRDEGGRFDEPTRFSYLDIIVREGERLTRLINDLLDLQRFEAGRMELEFEPVNLVDLIRDSTLVFQGTAETNHLCIDCELSAEPLMVQGHRDRLQQAVTNLVSNAVKFTESGGRITVLTQKLEDGGAPRVKVAVRDTGVGIPFEIQPLVFSKFQQAHKEMRKGGSGLGLALVREIVGYHKGEVGFESEPGRGSTFFFILNLSTEAMTPTA